MAAIESKQSRLYRMGVSKLALVGALTTITTSANAVMPLIAQQEITEKLGGAGEYQLFLEAVTIIAIPFLLTSPLILKGIKNKRVCQIGMILIAIVNFLLFSTDLEWNPLILRAILGVSYGITLPMGQFMMAEAEIEERDRVTQFTMMLNLIAAGLCIVPFIAISLLWAGNGDSKFIFLFLSITAAIVASMTERLISKRYKIQAYSLASIELPRQHLGVAIGDTITIMITRSIYALVLVWLSEIIHDFDTLQITSLFFTLPFVAWGFVAIPWVKKLGSRQSYLLFLVLPLLTLAVGLTTGTASSLPILLIVVALFSIPEAFTPGQLVSQWPSLKGRQFGNLLSMMLMTICLSIGPMLLVWITWLSQHLPIQAVPPEMQRSVWLLLLASPVYLIPLRLLWTRNVAPQLKQ